MSPKKPRRRARVLAGYAVPCAPVRGSRTELRADIQALARHELPAPQPGAV